MADPKTFASSHYAHSQVCFTPRWFLTHPALEFQSTALIDYKLFAQTLMRQRQADMDLGSRFLRYAHSTKASPPQHFYNRMWQQLTHFHCYFAPLHYRLEAPRGFPSRLL